jgi:hypothetical protein
MFVKMYFRNGVGDLQPQIPSPGTAFWQPPTMVLDSVIMRQTITSTRSIFYSLCCRTQSWTRCVFNIIPYLYLCPPHVLLSSDFTTKILAVFLYIVQLICSDIFLSRSTEGVVASPLLHASCSLSPSVFELSNSSCCKHSATMLVFDNAHL